MNMRNDSYRKFERAVREILLRDWDPIGIADNPHLRDEYDSYIPQIVGKVMGREPRQRLIDHLFEIETECIGLDGNRPRVEQVAVRLLGLPLRV